MSKLRAEARQRQSIKTTRLPHVPRGSDRPITGVACPCSFHMFEWLARRWWARTAGGIAPCAAADVPETCRSSFGRAAIVMGAPQDIGGSGS